MLGRAGVSHVVWPVVSPLTLMDLGRGAWEAGLDHTGLVYTSHHPNPGTTQARAYRVGPLGRMNPG